MNKKIATLLCARVCFMLFDSSDEERISGENKKATDRHRLQLTHGTVFFLLCHKKSASTYGTLCYYIYISVFMFCRLLLCFACFSRNSFFLSQLMDCWKNFSSSWTIPSYSFFLDQNESCGQIKKRKKKILNFFMVIVGWGRLSKSLKIELFKKVSQEIYFILKKWWEREKTRLRLSLEFAQFFLHLLQLHNE